MTNTTTIYTYHGWDVTIGWLSVDEWWYRAAKGGILHTGTVSAGNRVTAFNAVRGWIDGKEAENGISQSG